MYTMKHFSFAVVPLLTLCIIVAQAADIGHVSFKSRDSNGKIPVRAIVENYHQLKLRQIGLAWDHCVGVDCSGFETECLSDRNCANQGPSIVCDFGCCGLSCKDIKETKRHL